MLQEPSSRAQGGEGVPLDVRRYKHLYGASVRLQVPKFSRRGPVEQGVLKSSGTQLPVAGLYIFYHSLIVSLIISNLVLVHGNTQTETALYSPR